MDLRITGCVVVGFEVLVLLLVVAGVGVLLLGGLKQRRRRPMKKHNLLKTSRLFDCRVFFLL